MSDWSEDIAVAEAAAERVQAAEDVAEARFDAVVARAQAADEPGQGRSSDELQHWLAARRATDAAWGTWSEVMDSKPHN